MGENTRITIVDKNKDHYEYRVATDQVIIRNHHPQVGVVVSEGLYDLLGDIPITAISGWQAVVTDSGTGDTYSGTIIDVSQYGFLIEP